MGKKGKNTAKKKAARQEAKAAEKTDRELRRGLPARLDTVLAKGQEETKDIGLFADPPPKEECPICLYPLSLEGVCGDASFFVHSCCGQTICRGCDHASELTTDKINARKKKNKEPLLPYACAFCRTPASESYGEEFGRLFKRAAQNDGKSIFALGTLYRNGGNDAPKDDAKALDAFCRAAELGSTEAYASISIFYRNGDLFEESESKAAAFAGVAAKKGHIPARHYLGGSECERGNHAIAIRHYKIAAEAGDKDSLDVLKEYLKMDNCLLEEDEFVEILRKCLASQAEMKTDQRDAWVKDQINSPD